MSTRISRRDFLKATAAAMAALSLASQRPLPRARAAGKLMTDGPTSVASVTASLPTANEIVDVSTGWDGTQWATDTAGIPYLYDAQGQTWTPFGRGVDAAVLVDSDLYLFYGGELTIYNLTTKQATVQAIADQWPQLPPTFTSDLDGALAIGNNIYLFRSGRYVAVNDPGAVKMVNALPGWPADSSPDGVTYRSGMVVPGFKAGFIFPQPLGESLKNADGVGTLTLDADGQLAVDANAGLIFSEVEEYLFPNQADSGAVNAFAITTAGSLVFQGAFVWQLFPDSTQMAAASLGEYLPDVFPTLAHAPRGRAGNLWSLRAGDGAAVRHDGMNWTITGAPDGMKFISIDVGADNAVFGLAVPTGGGNATLYRYDDTSGVWQASAGVADAAPQQVSVGDATRVYVLESSGAVSRLQNGSLAGVGALGSGNQHIAANQDGTLWHANGSTSAGRFISERPTYPSAQIPTPDATVRKIASTGYGNAFMLVEQDGQQGVYAYSTPYMFKTSPSYVPVPDGEVLTHPQMAAGGGRCFVNIGEEIAALDSHTGAEEWITPIPGGGAFASLIYDPHLQMLYATDGQTKLMALDAATGEQQWFFETGCGPISPPALSGTGLCVAGSNQVYWINTRQALADGQADPGQAVTPVWSQIVSVANKVVDTCQSDYFEWEVALINGGMVYMIASYQGDAYLLTLSAQTGEVLASKVLSVFRAEKFALRQGHMLYSGSSLNTIALNIGTLLQMIVMSADGESVAYNSHDAPQNIDFSRGLAYHDGVFYVGGSDGNLYALNRADDDATFTSVTNGRVTDGGCTAGPVAVPDGAGGVILVFSGHPAGRSSDNAVFAYDPTTSSLVELDTDYLLAEQLTCDTNGIVYAGGKDPRDPGNPFGQVWAIRIADLIQQERDFIVESALMQDFDQPTGGTLAAVARYQTHVTIVDADKAPRPHQPVKVWADKATTVLIDGKSYAIDPTTHANVQSDATGMITMVTDAADLSTAALKLWAGFMDPHERIMVYPDRNLHRRLQSSTYQSTDSPEPGRINLATAAPYDMANLKDPAPLFSADQAPQATAVAGAMQKLTTSVGYRRGAATTTATTIAAAQSEAPTASRTYLAYDDLVAAAYSPVATPANQLATPTATGGLSFDGTTFAALSPADAANAIDALEGTSGDGLPGGFLSWLHRIWDDIKGAVAKVEKVVISIGRDIYLGLQYIEAGVKKVVRQAIHDIEEAAIAIGAMLVKLGKEIAQVVEALSIIFHLGEVVKTADLIKGVFATMTRDLAGAIADAKTTVDGFFSNAENEIDSAFDSIAAALAGAQAAVPAAVTAGISGLSGMGATPHSVFTIAPNGTGQPSSHAVPGMWGIHKVRQTYARGKPSATADENSLSQFLQVFFSKKGNLAQINQVHSNYRNQIKVASPKSFFAALLVDLLNGIKVLIGDALDLLEGLIDGFIKAADGIVDLIGAAAGLEIPILSALWKALTGNDLTFLDLIAFVVAIPVTLVYRVVEGSYPGDQSQAGASALASSVLAKVQGLTGAVTALLGGLVTAIFDTMDILDLESSVLGKIILVTVSLGMASALVEGDVLSQSGWTILISVGALVPLVLANIPDIPPEVPSATGFITSVLILMGAALRYEAGDKEEEDKLDLSADVISALPLIVNPLKFSDSLAVVVPPVADVACGLADFGLGLGSTIKAWDSLPAPTAHPETAEPTAPARHHVYLPSVRR